MFNPTAISAYSVPMTNAENSNCGDNKTSTSEIHPTPEVKRRYSCPSKDRTEARRKFAKKRQTHCIQLPASKSRTLPSLNAAPLTPALSPQSGERASSYMTPSVRGRDGARAKLLLGRGFDCVPDFDVGSGSGRFLPKHERIYVTRIILMPGREFFRCHTRINFRAGC